MTAEGGEANIREVFAELQSMESRLSARIDAHAQQSNLAALAQAKEQGSIGARLASLELLLGKVDGLAKSVARIDTLEAENKTLADKVYGMERQNFWRQNVGMVVGGLGGISGAIALLATKIH